MSFATSLDDFITTLFNAGSLTTFPLYINGAFRVKFPPEVNVLATVILLVSVALMFDRHAVGHARAASPLHLNTRFHHGATVFVYGTLRPGDVRWHVLEPFNARRRNARLGVLVKLFDTGLDYPAAVFGPRRHDRRADVRVGRGNCSSGPIAVLDEVEDVVGGEYPPRAGYEPTVVSTPGHMPTVRGLDLTPIPSGDWLLHRPLP